MKILPLLLAQQSTALAILLFGVICSASKPSTATEWLDRATAASERNLMISSNAPIATGEQIYGSFVHSDGDFSMEQGAFASPSTLTVTSHVQWESHRMTLNEASVSHLIAALKLGRRASSAYSSWCSYANC